MPIRLITTPPTNGGATNYTLVKTAWGYLGFACRGARLIRLILPGLSKSALSQLLRTEFANVQYDPEVLPHLQQSLIAYFQAQSTDFDCDVDISWATPFAQKVYKSCCQIPLGQTTTYAALAHNAGSPRAVRAVGSIMASNRIPLIIPCHRVLRSDGKLGGFSAGGGQNLKKRMIINESNIQADRIQPQI